MNFPVLKGRMGSRCPLSPAVFFRATFVVCTFTALLAAREFPEYPVHPIRQYQSRQTQSGITVAIEPVTDREAQKLYLGTDLKAKRYLPVMVLVENANEGGSVMFQRDDIELSSAGNSQSGALGTTLIEGVSHAGQAVATAAIPAALVGASLPAVLIAAKLMAVSSEIRHNLVIREFRTQTVMPGKSASGFFYLPFSTAGDHPSFRIAARFSEGGPKMVFNLPLPAIAQH